MRAPVFASLFLAAAFGCSATNTVQFPGASSTAGSESGTTGKGSSGTAGTGASGQGGATGQGGGIGLGGGLTVGQGGGTPGCSAAAELVYVFATDSDIWSFDPPSKQFTKVATPNCPASSPNSMAIDRDLVAWLNYIGGIYTFDLKTKGACVDSGITLPPGFEQVGMGFSTDAVGGTAETLYIDGIGGAGLAKIDMATMSVVPIGTFGNDSKLSGQSAELTGTGDARLFGYFTTENPYVRVAQLDKTTSNILSDNAPQRRAAAAATGRSRSGAATSTSTRRPAPTRRATAASSTTRPSTNAVDATYVADVGFSIIGAGVSTCAPLVAPQ